jgi:hypothetical protein
MMKHPLLHLMLSSVWFFQSALLKLDVHSRIEKPTDKLSKGSRHFACVETLSNIPHHVVGKISASTKWQHENAQRHR